MKKAQVTGDFLTEEAWKWKSIEDAFSEVLTLHDYQEIRLPILQDREVLQKGIGALAGSREALQAAQRTIDVCPRETDSHTLSLRPEGTISILYHTALHSQKGQVSRYYYHGPMFKKAPDGKAQEFFQLGVELLGSDSLLTENEVISLGMRILNALGFRDASLKLNSYGCEDCRRKFFADVRANLESNVRDYCKTCYEELHLNPFADTRCQDKSCRHDLKAGPQIEDYLCAKCRDNFSRIRKIQANLGHPFRVDPHLYKNFAYYNETVFDFCIPQEGREITVGGGGRYDYLSNHIAKRNLPAVGFSLDLDVIFSLMEARRLFLPLRKNFSVYISAQSPNMEMMLLQIAQELHAQGIKTVLGTDSRNTADELANAKSHNCDIMITIREENIREGKLLLHNVSREDQAYIPLNHLTESVEIARKTLKK